MMDGDVDKSRELHVTMGIKNYYLFIYRPYAPSSDFKYDFENSIYYNIYMYNNLYNIFTRE